MVDENGLVFLAPSDSLMIPGGSSRSQSIKKKGKEVKGDSSRLKSKRKRGSGHKCAKVDESIGLALRLKETIEEVLICLDSYKILF